MQSQPVNVMHSTMVGTLMPTQQAMVSPQGGVYAAELAHDNFDTGDKLHRWSAHCEVLLIRYQNAV
jgi:hypothetical protein